MADESEGRVVIRPEIERSHRFAGWLMLGMVSLFLGLSIWIATLPNLRIKAGEMPVVVFAGAMVLLLFSAGAIMGMRMAFETQRWIVGANYFECRRGIFGFEWSKTYHATAWRVERLDHTVGINFGNRVGSYSLAPTGARVGGSLLPFYSTSSASDILRLGRQLAGITGWPLRICTELARLEKELEL